MHTLKRKQKFRINFLLEWVISDADIATLYLSRGRFVFTLTTGGKFTTRPVYVNTPLNIFILQQWQHEASGSFPTDVIFWSLQLNIIIIITSNTNDGVQCHLLTDNWNTNGTTPVNALSLLFIEYFVYDVRSTNTDDFRYASLMVTKIPSIRFIFCRKVNKKIYVR